MTSTVRGMVGSIVGQGRAAGGPTAETAGLAGRLLDFFGPLVGPRRSHAQRRMKMIEALALGGNRRLVLVECDGAKFLVGVGGDSVGTIVPVRGEAAAEAGDPCGD